MGSVESMDENKIPEQEQEKNVNSTCTTEEEMLASVEAMKQTADRALEEASKHPFHTADVVRDILGFFVTTAIAFGWTLLMLLILSFISLGYLHFKFDHMVLCAAVVAAATAVYYLVRKVNKYRKYR